MITTTATDLRVFSDPTSVAVVGASEDAAKWGYWLASGALTGAHRRSVHMVNARSRTVLGHRCAPAVSDLDQTPELVALCVPAPHVDGVVDEALTRGTRGFLGITSGMADDAALAARISSAGARLVGTNSLGIYDATTDLRLMWGIPTPGPMAVVSQSGQLGSELIAIGRRYGLGVSRFVSIGNQSDVTAIELLADLADHDDTRVIALYLESFADGEALFDTLAILRATGKPTILLTVGASSASTRLARTHTGSLTSSLDAVDAACRSAGVVRVATPAELVDVARAFLAVPTLAGRRVAVVGDSGGQSGIAADVAVSAGLTVPQFSDELTKQLDAQLPAGAATANPVDLAGAGERDLENYAAIVEQVGGAGGVDAVILTGYFGCYGHDVPDLTAAEVAVTERIGQAARSMGIPVIVHTMAPDSVAAQSLWKHGVPTYGRIESVTRVLAALADARPTVRPEAPQPLDEPESVQGSYWHARALLTTAGITFPAAALVHDSTDLDVALTGLTAPLVLKAAWLEHKSEVGGVRVNLRGPAEVHAAFDDMRARLGPGEYVLEKQDCRSDTVEVLIAARRDPQLGPMVVVGAGGTDTEVLRDIRMECAPVSTATATTMVESLRMAPLLKGWRGRAPVSVPVLAETVATVSRLIAARPDIAEIELNPVRAGAADVIAVDALVLNHCTTTESIRHR